MQNNTYTFNGKNYDTFKGLKIATQSRIRTLESLINLTYRDNEKCNKLKDKLQQIREEIKNIKPNLKPIYKYSCTYCISGKMTQKEIEGIKKVCRINKEPCSSCKVRQRRYIY